MMINPQVGAHGGGPMSETKKLRDLMALLERGPGPYPGTSQSNYAAERARLVALVSGQAVLAFEEVVAGIPSMVTCDACHGSGLVRV